MSAPERLSNIRCTCLFYGHGLSLTRVDTPYCPVHHPMIEALVNGERTMIEIPVDP